MTKEMNDTVVWAFRKSPVQPYIDLSKVSDYLLCRALDDSYSHIPLIAIRTGEIHDPDGTIHPVFSNGRLLAQKLSANGFSNTDVLRLTEYGEDVLYQLKKDWQTMWLLRASVVLGSFSLIATLLGLWLSK
ncbi:hypothetical protein [Selenomonas noxia]|jgi:hypothetical protein|uniref:hypothetical protein n=1 Tax=Selenomonas noxia TaxID=135083 RepID=UPI00205B4549|nr:hypothetical protein [Selenomonas noxia]DAR69658.1 MAG TPA: hypothetical protein [Caudoviricetes sp.]